MGVFISKFNLQEFEQERITLFVVAVLVLVVTGIIILIVRVVNYFDKKNSYLNRIQKLVIDLKQIDLLYKLN